MKTFPLCFVCALVLGAAALATDTRDVQRELKSQGFYYGEIDGQSGGETAAALKRFQIRNGLEVTGTANEETLDELGFGGGSAATKTPRTQPGPPATAPAPEAPQPQREPTHLRRDPVEESDRAFLRREEAGLDVEPYDRSDVEPYDPSVVRRPVPLTPPPAPGGDVYSEVFANTPYETAPSELQQSTVQRAQRILAQAGHYRTTIDGIPGPATEEAILAYQRRARLPLTGQLDLHTLNAMRLLPGRGGPPMQPFRVPRGSGSSRSFRGIWVE